MLKTEQETGVTLHTKLKFYLCKEPDNFQVVGLNEYSLRMASVKYPVPLLCKESRNRLLFLAIK